MDFKLNLLKIIKQHLIFYIFLFLNDPADPLSEKIYLKSGLMEVNDDNDEKYKINNIINVKTTKRMIMA